MFSVVFLVLLYSFSPKIYQKTVKLMGNRFDISVVAENQTDADRYIGLAISEITRIEKLISSWDEDSQTSLINKNAGIRPVKVDRELFELIERAIQISKLTDGAFDITYASMDRIWVFDGSMTKLPDAADIKNAIKHIGYKRIILDSDKSTVFLPQNGMKIGFGAIGKGYAADRAKILLISNGVKAGIVNASGDLNTWGTRPDGEKWNIAVTNPLDKSHVVASIKLMNNAIVTSGNYEKFVMINGRRFSHIIDPRTGYPTQGIASVSVIAPQAEIADALATSIFVMGIEIGLDRINQLPKIECVIIDNNGKLYLSQNMEFDRR